MAGYVFEDGEVLSAQKINSRLNHTLLEPVAYTPTVTNANATAAATYMQIGKLIEVEFFVTFSGAASGTVIMRLPAPVANLAAMGASRHAIGQALAFDSSPATYRDCSVLVAGAQEVSFLNAASGALVAAAVPFTWANGDTLRGRCTYWTE